MFIQKHFKIRKYKKIKKNHIKETQLTAGPLGARAIDSHQKHLAKLGQDKNQLWQGGIQNVTAATFFLGQKPVKQREFFNLYSSAVPSPKQ